MFTGPHGQDWGHAEPAWNRAYLSGASLSDGDLHVVSVTGPWLPRYPVQQRFWGSVSVFPDSRCLPALSSVHAPLRAPVVMEQSQARRADSTSRPGAEAEERRPSSMATQRERVFQSPFHLLRPQWTG